MICDAPFDQAGIIHGSTLSSRKIQAHERLRRTKPATADSPVAKVQRMISMFRKYCITTARMQAQKKTKPERKVMYGQRMNSPLPRARPARMMLGPIIWRSEMGGGIGRSRKGGSMPAGMTE